MCLFNTHSVSHFARKFQYPYENFQYPVSTTAHTQFWRGIPATRWTRKSLTKRSIIDYISLNSNTKWWMGRVIVQPPRISGLAKLVGEDDEKKFDHSYNSRKWLDFFVFGAGWGGNKRKRRLDIPPNLNNFHPAFALHWCTFSDLRYRLCCTSWLDTGAYPDIDRKWKVSAFSWWNLEETGSAVDWKCAWIRGQWLNLKLNALVGIRNGKVGIIYIRIHSGRFQLRRIEKGGPAEG